MNKLLTVLGLLASLLWIDTATAARDFPPGARRGTLVAHQYPQYQIGSVTYRMAAGGRIYNRQNLIIMPASLQQQSAEVVYRLDLSGQISAIWLLTPEEAALHPKSTTETQE